jgi:NADH:ubiquinone oxidoreductase subunit B-like Fe-S oxidoreductase
MNSQVSALPFAADRAKADGERYRRIFVELARHADVVVAAATAGALTHEEALAVMRRHAQTLATAVALLDARDCT